MEAMSLNGVSAFRNSYSVSRVAFPCQTMQPHKPRRRNAKEIIVVTMRQAYRESTEVLWRE